MKAFAEWSVKRPELKVRSWLAALLRLTLLQGSLATGLYQHDIVRDFAKARHPILPYFLPLSPKFAKARSPILLFLLPHSIILLSLLRASERVVTW